MKYDRVKNTVRGTAFGFINRLICLVIPFFVRTILIRILGMEYLGLGSLFNSLLGVLSLAELGIGSAIVFSMYHAIADGDKKMVCSLMAFYKKAYHVVGIIVLGIGLLIMPVLPVICPQTLPDNMNLYLLYLIYLTKTVISYFLFAYKNCLLTAFQRTDIASNIGSIVNMALYLFQITVLLVFKNYYYYVMLIPIFDMAQNIVTACFVRKKYPQYIAVGNLDSIAREKILKKMKALFLYRVGSVVLTSVDSIVISAFLGLEMLGEYNSYYYVVYTLFGFLQVYYTALTPGVGNSIFTEEVDKNYQDFRKLFFLHNWIIGWCTVCLVCLYQPFIALWIGREHLFPMGAVVCFAVYFYIWKMMDVVNIYKEALGMWEYDKYRQIFASGMNLMLNLILVKKIGIYGILLSTILSIVIITLPWSTLVLFKYYFKKGLGDYFKRYLLWLSVTAVTCGITYYVCNLLLPDLTFQTLSIRGLICIIMPNALFWGIHHFSVEYKNTMRWISIKFGVLYKKKQ